MPEKKEYKVYLDVLNVISALAVVFLHFNGIFWTFSYERYWVTANFIETFFYFAVPVFFMISGATLIDYRRRYTTKQFLKKRFEKTLIPFIFWSLFGTAYLAIFGGLSMDGMLLSDLFNAVFNTSHISIYWFFITLFSVYLCIPVFGAIPEEDRKNIFGYVIMLALCLNVLFPFLFGLTDGKLQYNGGLNMTIAGGYLLYVLIGYYIDRYEIPKECRILIYILGIGGFLLHWLGTWHFSYEVGYIDMRFKGYFAIPCILASVAVFVFFKYQDYSKWNVLLLRLINWLRGESFAIYLIHYYVYLFVVNTIGFNPRSIVLRVGGGLVTFFAVAAFSKFVKQLGFVQKILP